MIREWLEHAATSWGAMLALLLFFIVFLGVLAWVFRPGSRKTYDEAAQLPLENNERPGNGNGRAQETDDGERAG